MRIVLMLVAGFAYCAGSIPWGLVLARWFTGQDIRKMGSGNIGATNVRRVAGTGLGLLTLAGDVGKGLLPAALAVALAARRPADPWMPWLVALVCFCAFLGHLFPLYLKGRGGGKGVATAAGVFLAVSPAAVGTALLVFALLVCVTSRVSAGSMAAAVFLPLGVWVATGAPPYTVCAGVAAAFILARHGDNMRRLVAGTEPRI